MFKGYHKPIQNEKTLEKVKKVKKLEKEGLSRKIIASRLNLSISRISELSRGVNWVSK